MKVRELREKLLEIPNQEAQVITEYSPSDVVFDVTQVVDKSVVVIRSKFIPRREWND